MIHYFNPGHETAVLNDSPYYMPAANQCKMQYDLAYLPAWYASRDDYIFTDNDLPEDFIHSVIEGLSLPRTVSEIDFSKNKSDFRNSEIFLWGLSPQSVHFFCRMSEKYDLAFRGLEISSEYKNICSRHTSRDCLEYLINSVPEFDSDILPVFFSNLRSIEKIIHENFVPFLVKSPYSSSGRGLLWLSSGDLHQSERQILTGMLNRQGEVSVEPALNKTIDFSAQFILSHSGEVEFSGFSLFQTTNKGAYVGNMVLSQEKTESEITSYIDRKLLLRVTELQACFLKEKLSFGYSGNVGVDMMIYEKDGNYSLHPCVEINVRKNMGFLSMMLYRNHLIEGKEGFFCIDFEKQPGVMFEKHSEMRKKYPCIFENNRIKSGYLSLCPINENTKYRACLIVK